MAMQKAFYTPPKSAGPTSLDEAWPLQLADRHSMVRTQLAMTPGREDLRTAVWSPFNPRSRAWASGSLLQVAREHRLQSERLNHASSPMLLRSSSQASSRGRRSARWLHNASTESLRSQRWPRGELGPMEEPDARAADALLPATLSRPHGRIKTPARQLYSKQLTPATYNTHTSPSRRCYDEQRFPTQKGMVWGAPTF